MLIGYQGIIGSYSQRAAKQLAESAKLLYAEYVPLTTSAEVVRALKNDEVSYGVVAAYNSIGGEVVETAEALKGFDYYKVTALIMPIHQCIFKLNPSVPNESINKIKSHVQALSQTKESLKKYFPFAKQTEIEDTALGAKNLSEGIYDKYTAVVCSREAGEYYGLTMMYENIEDDDSNRTMFYLIEKK